jgi:hypothetical protein
MKRLTTIAIALAIGAFAGFEYESSHIQKTCEAPDGATILNGTPYLCFSQHQIDVMRAQRERGV